MIVSDELRAWCQRASWAVHELPDGVVELIDSTGHLDLRVSATNPLSNMLEVFEVDHAGHGNWVIEAQQDDIERYLAVRLSKAVRAALSFAPLVIPGAPGQEQAGFELDFEDVVVVVKEGEVDRAFFPRHEREAAEQPHAWVQFTRYAALYLPELYAMLSEADGDGPFAGA